MKQSRIISFIIIFLIYVVASVFGVLVFNYLNYDLWAKLLISDIFATLIVFLFSLLLKNASVYDPYWSVAPLVILGLLALNIKLTSSSALVLIAVFVWGIRLTLNWAYTFKNLYHQDWRYTMLKEKTKKFYPFINLFGIHMFPTLVVYLCVLPAVYLITFQIEANVLTYIFFVFALMSAVIQGLADCQMHKYKLNKITNYINSGLWKYSRHPNYLGEIMMWFSIDLLVVLTVKGNYFFLIGAIVNFVMFMVVSIPMAEKRQSKKEGFVEYKKKTRMLLPFKKIID